MVRAPACPGFSPDDARNALEGLGNMAGRNVAAAIEAHIAEIGSRFDALESQLATLQIMVSVLGLFS